MGEPACMAEQVAMADLLLQARRSRRPMMPPPEWARLAEADAYAVQDLVIAGIMADAAGTARAVGWKIGCTNEKAQALLGIARPFYGRLLSPFVHESPARLDAGDFNMRCIEPEFAFRIGRDLDPAQAPFDRAAIEAVIDAVLPAIEIVDTRFADWTRVGAGWVIADNGSAGHWVQGRAVADWRRFDLPAQAVRMIVNGGVLREGRGAHVMGDPLAALMFLANAMAWRGRGLKAGELVSTGTATDVCFAAAGDRIEADFGPLGTVSVQF